ARLSNNARGANFLTATASSPFATLTPGDLAGLTISCPNTGVFVLPVEAISTEINGPITAGTQKFLTIKAQGPDITSFDVPSRCSYGDSFSLTAAAQEPGETSLTYSWTVTGPNGFQFAANTATTSFTAGDDGTYSVTLKVTDSHIYVARRTGTIQVINVP